MQPAKLILSSPLQGWCAPLDEAPDPVFAGRMMGDGVAIDPTGNCLYAPCDGVLTVVSTDGRNFATAYRVVGMTIQYAVQGQAFALEIESISDNRMVQLVGGGQRLACDRNR